MYILATTQAIEKCKNITYLRKNFFLFIYLLFIYLFICL